MRITAIVLVLVTFGCGDAEAMRRDEVRTICDAPAACGATCESSDPTERSRLLAVYIGQHGAIGAQREFFDLVIATPRGQRGERYRAVARQAGVATCPMADVLDETDRGAGPPPR